MGSVHLEPRARRRRKVSHEPTYKPGDLIHVVGNSYLVVRVLGSGGMGAVYWTMDKELDEPRVLKVLHPDHARNRPDIVDRFLREARAMVKIKHDNIVRVIGLHRVMDPWRSPCFSMEALEGHSLADAIANGGMELPHRALHVLYQTLAGLAAMHARGVVHRDIKPGNLFLYTAGREDVLIKILDLGVIRLVADETEYEGFVGTYGYASDRQLSGKLAEPEDDVFAAMLVGYECLTGTYAFEKYGMSREGALARIGKRPPPLRDHGLDCPDLEQLFEKAFDPDPTKRFRDALSALREVKKLHKKYSEHLAPPPRGPSTTQDRPVAEPLTQALLSPTRPDQMPAWLEELRRQAPIAVRVADSEVDERGPTTPGPRLGGRTIDQRLSRPARALDTMESPGAPLSIERTDVHRAATVQPSAPLPAPTPPMAVAEGIEYVPSSKPAGPESSKERKPGPKCLILNEAIEKVGRGAFMIDTYPCIIGREASDIVYDFRGISSKHARLDFDGQRFLLTDLKSTNGTFVRRERKLHRLEPNVPFAIEDDEMVILSALELRVFLGTKRSDAALGELIRSHGGIDKEQGPCPSARERSSSPARRSPVRKRASSLHPALFVALGASITLLLAALAWMALR